MQVTIPRHWRMVTQAKLGTKIRKDVTEVDPVRIGLKESLNNNNKASWGGSNSGWSGTEGPKRKVTRKKQKFKHVNSQMKHWEKESLVYYAGKRLRAVWSISNNVTLYYWFKETAGVVYVLALKCMTFVELWHICRIVTFSSILRRWNRRSQCNFHLSRKKLLGKI